MFRMIFKTNFEESETLNPAREKQKSSSQQRQFSRIHIHVVGIGNSY